MKSKKIDAEIDQHKQNNNINKDDAGDSENVVV